MAYAAWSVVAGEQPTAAKWNILGTNDASFNDGSGLAFTNNNTVPANALATNAITLGSATITSSFSVTASQTTPQQVTGLTATVTIPAGGRKILITAFAYGMLANSISNVIVSIWDGVVNVGTKIGGTTAVSPTAAYDYPCIVMALVTPAAGSKTYNVGLNNSLASNASLEATATTPAFLLVQAI